MGAVLLLHSAAQTTEEGQPPTQRRGRGRARFWPPEEPRSGPGLRGHTTKQRGGEEQSRPRAGFHDDHRREYVRQRLVKEGKCYLLVIKLQGRAWECSKHMAGRYLTHPIGVSPGKGNEKWKSLMCRRPASYQHMLALVMIPGDASCTSHYWHIHKFKL